MRSFRLLVQAKEELRDAAGYYESRATGLGLTFSDQIDSALADLRENPERWPVVKRNVRRRLVQQFPYSLLYRVELDEIVVLAVMHQSRHPYYWKGRS